jgi:acyl carrier protein
MDSTALAAFLREALRKHSRIRLVRIRDEDVVTKDLGFDSFALLKVVLEVEDHFGVEIDPTRLVNLREITFSEFVELVRDHLGDAPAAGQPRAGTA